MACETTLSQYYRVNVLKARVVGSTFEAPSHPVAHRSWFPSRVFQRQSVKKVRAQKDDNELMSAAAWLPWAAGVYWDTGSTGNQYLLQAITSNVQFWQGSYQLIPSSCSITSL